MTDCPFCKIVRKEIPAKIVYEDEEIIGFHDINPQAPVHILVIPKKHIEDLTKIEGKEVALLGNILIAIKKIAEEKKLEMGFRTVINTKEAAGQSVFHLHFHLLGGRIFHWPPG